jgi:hypothetical protein
MRLLPVVNVVCKTKKGGSREGWDWSVIKADREAVVQGQVNGRYMAEYRVFRCTPKCFFASMWPCKLWWRLDVKTPRQARSDSASLTDFVCGKAQVCAGFKDFSALFVTALVGQ